MICSLLIPICHSIPLSYHDQCLALAGGQFDGGCDVCGVMVSLKHQDDALSVWNKDAENRESILKIRCALLTVFTLFTPEQKAVCPSQRSCSLSYVLS